MRKFTAVLAGVLAAAVAYPAFAADGDTPAQQATPGIRIEPGKMLYTASGSLVAPAYKVAATGEPQVVTEDRLVTIPAATLAMSGGKLTTSLSNPEIRRMAR